MINFTKLNDFAFDYLQMNDANIECVNRESFNENDDDEIRIDDRFKFTNDESFDDRELYYDYDFIAYVYNVLCAFDEFARNEFDEQIDVYRVIIRDEYEQSRVNMNMHFDIQLFESQREFIMMYDAKTRVVTCVTQCEYYMNHT